MTETYCSLPGDRIGRSGRLQKACRIFWGNATGHCVDCNEGFVDVYLCQNSLLKNVHLKYASFIILKLYSSKTGKINLIVQACFIAPLIPIMEKEKKKRKFITFL